MKSYLTHINFVSAAFSFGENFFGNDRQRSSFDSILRADFVDQLAEEDVHYDMPPTTTPFDVPDWQLIELELQRMGASLGQLGHMLQEEHMSDESEALANYGNTFH